MSEYQDKRLTCVECGSTFVWSEGEQEFFHQKGFNDQPKRCKICRLAKRQRRENPQPPKAA